MTVQKRITAFYLLSFFIYLFSLLLSCSPTESVFKDQKITLQADAGVTEAWLTLSAEPVKADAVYTVKRDTTLIFKGRLNKSDTLLYDSGLKPNEDYKYTAYAELNGQRSPQTETEIVTMDTTSHNFSWTTYEFGGQGGSSAFYDVAIIDENDIWAVGEIYTADNQYNAAHWDGEKWELKQINGYITPIHVILVFNKNDIWFEGVLHFDGVKYKRYNNNFPLMPNGDGWNFYSTWGTSSEDFYVVGQHGMIAHYNGHSWTKIASGTDLPINDIYGVNNKMIFLPACYIIRFGNDSNEKKLLYLSDNKLFYYYWPYSHRELASVWIDEKNILYTCGGGIFKRFAYNKWKEYKMNPLIMTTRIRGNASNDIFVVGHYGLLLHYNGLTWKHYTVFNEIDIFKSIDVKNNIAVAVGFNGTKAVIYKRN